MITLPTDTLAISSGYFYDPQKAQKRLGYIANYLGITLYKWQREILDTYFGWVNAEGEYRFNKIACFIPKSNGKSYFIAALTLYKLFELRNARLYSCASNANQAAIICDHALSILRNSKALAPQLQKAKQLKGVCSQYRKEIEYLPNNTKYKSLADSVDANDGLKAMLMVVDEIHRMKPSLVNVCMNATKLMVGSLTVVISTAGDGDKTHPAYQQYDLAKRVQQGKSDDIHLLPAIWECSDELKTEEEIYDIDKLIACNPVLQEDNNKLLAAIEELKEAREVRNDSDWKRMRLNVWMAQDGNEYIDLDIYQRCEIAEEPDLTGSELFIGFDKGGTWDFTGITFLFRLADGSIYEKQFTFAVQDKLPLQEDKDDMSYQQYVDNELTIIPSEAILDVWLTEWIMENIKPYNLKCFAADGYLASYVLESLNNAGYEVLKVPQGNNRLLTPCIEDYFDRIRQGKIKHLANRLVDWQLTCCRKYSTAKDCVKLVKGGSNSKGNGGYGHIDNIDSTICALAVLRASDVAMVTYSGGCTVG